jgi:hypothetical protein
MDARPFKTSYDDIVAQSGGARDDKPNAKVDARYDAYYKKRQKIYKRRKAEKSMDKESRDFFADPKKVGERLKNGS